jgi:hydrogenase/urease accessory protein HupE
MLICRSVIVTLLVLYSTWCYAHPPGLSSLDVLIKDAQVEVKVTFALQDIEAFLPMDSDLDAEVSDAERESAKPAIVKLMAEQLKLVIDGQEVKLVEFGGVNFDHQNNAQVIFSYAAAPQKQLQIQSNFLSLLPDGHQQYLTMRAAEGRVLQEKMLGKQSVQADLEMGVSETIEGSSVSLFATFSDFFKLGVEHIVTGYDHLLFLFALLAVTHSFWPAIKIITFFTVAHSITLACAGLNLVELPSSFVEPFIAATIVYVAVENIIRGDHPKGRHWLTFGFGLVHGFGFAGVLRELDISSGEAGILMPLLSFNLGIETGQIVVASIVLPMIWWLNSRVETAEKFLKGCSFVVSLMGIYWLLERTVLQ